jgi:hypothetical protein
MATGLHKTKLIGAGGERDALVCREDGTGVMVAVSFTLANEIKVDQED